MCLWSVTRNILSCNTHFISKAPLSGELSGCRKSRQPISFISRAQVEERGMLRKRYRCEAPQKEQIRFTLAKRLTYKYIPSIRNFTSLGRLAEQLYPIVPIISALQKSDSDFIVFGGKYVFPVSRAVHPGLNDFMRALLAGGNVFSGH